MHLGQFTTNQSNIKISQPFAYLTFVLAWTAGVAPTTTATLIAEFKTKIHLLKLSMKAPDGTYKIPEISLKDLAEITAGWSDRFIRVNNTTTACTARIVVPIGCEGSIPANTANDFTLSLSGFASHTVDIYATPADTLDIVHYKYVPITLKTGQQNLQLNDNDVDVCIALPADITNLQIFGQTVGELKNDEIEAFKDDIGGVMYIANGAVETYSDWLVWPIMSARKFLITMATEGPVWLVRRVGDAEKAYLNSVS